MEIEFECWDRMGHFANRQTESSAKLAALFCVSLNSADR
jgi:hypothetical protein